jgi:LCP family protein required for cell wall assembly
VTHVRHDGGPRGSGGAGAGGGSAADPGRELDELLSRWARERDNLYQQDSSWLDELRTGGPLDPGTGRHAAQDAPWKALPSGSGSLGRRDQLPVDHPSYPGYPGSLSLPRSEPTPSGGLSDEPDSEYGYPSLAAYGHSAGAPEHVDLRQPSPAPALPAPPIPALPAPPIPALPAPPIPALPAPPPPAPPALHGPALPAPHGAALPAPPTPALPAPQGPVLPGPHGAALPAPPTPTLPAPHGSVLPGPHGAAMPAPPTPTLPAPHGSVLPAPPTPTLPAPHGSVLPAPHGSVLPAPHGPILPPPHGPVLPADDDYGLLTHRDDAHDGHDAPGMLPLTGDYPAYPEPGLPLDLYPEPPDPFGPGEPSTLPPSGPRHGRHRRGRYPRWLKVAGWIGAMTGILVVTVAGWGLYEYRKLSGNVRRIDVLAPNDPSIREAAKQRDAENFLLIGSDTRSGANGKYEDSIGQVIGQRSDTTILAHLSPNRDKAILVSIPRDSWVDIPGCRKRDGSTSPPGKGMFNSAFETGGPRCTVLAVQKLTGISVNHYVQVDFTGFKTMVDALSGVPICSRQDVYDKESGLRLRRGDQVLRGEQALAYVRARKHIGDWSDLGRIQRQQRFLGAMIRKATSSRLLFNPIALTRFLGAATRSLTLDPNTSFSDLKQLGDQLRNLDPKRVTFLTAPIADADYSPPGYAGGGRVLLDNTAGRRLWDSIINDKPAAKGARAAAGQRTTLSVAPGDVSVRVLNGVGIQGLARRTAAELTSVGFAVTDATNSPTPTNVTLVRYAPGRLETARTLAAAVPGAVLQEDATLGRTVLLVIGQDQVKVVGVQVGDPAPATPSSRPPAPAATAKPLPSTTAADASCG